MPTREPSFAAKKFMADMFAMPSSRNGCAGGSIPLLFRNALPAPRPWEQKPHAHRVQLVQEQMQTLEAQHAQEQQ